MVTWVAGTIGTQGVLLTKNHGPRSISVYQQAQKVLVQRGTKWYTGEARGHWVVAYGPFSTARGALHTDWRSLRSRDDSSQRHTDWPFPAERRKQEPWAYANTVLYDPLREYQALTGIPLRVWIEGGDCKMFSAPEPLAFSSF